MENKRILLVFKFDGILLNTVELYVKKIWSMLSAWQIIPSDVIEEKIDNLIILNWDKNTRFLANLICHKIGAPEYAAKLGRELEGLDYSLAEDYRLNQDLMNMVGKMKNADFQVALYTRRDLANLKYIARLVGLNLEIFDYLLTDDHLPANRRVINPLLELKAGHPGEIIYFGNTEEDASFCGQNIHCIIAPETNRRDGENDIDEEGNFIIDYLHSYLNTRKFSVKNEQLN